MSVSSKLIQAYKLYPGARYKLGQKLDIHPSTLSQIINGIIPVKNGDPRVLRLGECLGLKPNELFEKEKPRVGRS